MARHLKYPELLTISIGQSFVLKEGDFNNVQTVRNIVYRTGAKHNLTFEVHYDWRTNEIMISRVAPRDPVAVIETRNRVIDTPVRGYTSHEEKMRRIAEIAAQLDAED